LKKALIFLLCLTTFASAQQRSCGSSYRLNHFINENPSFLTKRQTLESLTTNFKKKSKSNLIIPVVVHVVYKNTNENISNSQIISQIDVLSKDFTRTNTDAFNTPTSFLPMSSDMQISFCLAQQDSDGNPTDGIIRKQTSNSFFPLYGNEIFFDSLGGSNAWDTKKYLNIWVCMIEAGVLGWAQLPYGGNIETDGVVIDFEHFGTNGTAISPYNLGRTATHEIGHWFNLFHIWGDSNCGDDLVNDTPTQKEENFGCKIHPHPSCNNTGDMFMNFMDYTNDNCMNLFTQGQRDRAWSAITNFRNELISSNGCSPALIPNSDAGIIDIISPNNAETNCSNPIRPIVILKNYGSTVLNSVKIKYSVNSGLVNLYTWNGLLSPNEADTITLSPIASTGTNHFLSVSTYLPNNSTDINTSNDESTQIFSSIGGSSVLLKLQTDNYAEETSWKLMSDNNNIILTGDSLMDNKLYEKEICLLYGCFKFVINDSYGDGFCCNFGNGYYTINYTNNASPLAYLSQFNFTDTSYFCIGATNSINLRKSFNIYPNPSSGRIYLQSNNTNENNSIFAVVLNSLGQVVTNTRVTKNRLDLSHLKNGIYQIIIKTKDNLHSQKLIIQK
jgi:hypothetical protein